jgi:hypothetical protein
MALFESLNLAVSWGLLVLIWLVQIIIYPAFDRIPAEDFRAFHRWYTVRIAAIVAPPMIGEALLTLHWIWSQPRATPALAATTLVAVVWLSTFGLQVPLHRRLQQGKAEDLIRRLVATNWVRTLAWSAKAVVVTINAV